eukprot:6208835-Pleurochrysis_carterae.AAC.1
MYPNDGAATAPAGDASSQRRSRPNRYHNSGDKERSRDSEQRSAPAHRSVSDVRTHAAFSPSQHLPLSMSYVSTARSVATQRVHQLGHSLKPAVRACELP